MLGVDIITLLTFVLFLFALAHYFQRSDEFLFLPILFFLATGVMRYQAVLNGDAKWAEVAYAYDIFDLNDELGEEALNYFFFGTATFVIAYYFFINNLQLRPVAYDSPKLFYRFLGLYRMRIIYLFFGVLVVSALANRAISGADGLAYGMSYFLYFQFAIGGMILLMYLVFDTVDWQRQSTDKMLFGGSIALAAYLSYNPYMRFQFLSWMIALAIFWGKSRLPVTKIRYYLVGGVLAITVFSLAGNDRHAKFDPLSFGERLELAYNRLFIAEDLNMLDGLMMVLQVYPEHLEYHYGMEHLEILMRPIPRAIWPEKPVGGYANKLGLNDNMEGQSTVGISQTIYGSFYGEGGVVGIVVFSGLYAFMFVRLFQLIFRFQSPMRFLLKGIVFASWVPMLRGGDLPGIYAFVGMSYWPVFLFLWLYFRFLKAERVNAVQEIQSSKLGINTPPQPQ